MQVAEWEIWTKKCEKKLLSDQLKIANNSRVQQLFCVGRVSLDCLGRYRTPQSFDFLFSRFFFLNVYCSVLLPHGLSLNEQ